MPTETLHPPHTQTRAAWRGWRGLLWIWLLTLSVWIPHYWLSRPIALQDPDAQDYAQIARNVYQGKGFTTSVMPLGGLEWRRQTERLDAPWWNLHRFPMPSLVMAGLFHLVGDNDFGVTLSSALFFFAGIPLVFAFARRLFDDRVALLAAFLFALGGGPLENSITGLTEAAATFYFLAALHLVLWPRGRWSLPLAGALTGLAFLNRYSVVLYGLPMLFLLWRAHRDRPWAALLAFTAPGALVAAPWLVRNYLLAGDPMFSLTTALMVRYMTEASPRAHDWYQFVYEMPFAFMAAHPAWAIRKALMQLGDMWWIGFERIGDMRPVMPFFLLSLLRPMPEAAERLRRWLFWVFALHFTVLALLSNIPRYYAVFVPFVCIYAAETLLWLWGLVRPRVPRRHLAFVAVFGLPLLLNWAYVAGPPRKPREDRTWVEWNLENQTWIRANTAKDAVIVTDVPWSVAWYGQRGGLPLPPSPDDMVRFTAYDVHPDGIYLKAPRKRMNVPDGWDIWRRVQFGREAIPGYRLAHIFSDDAVYYERVGP